MLRNKNNFWQKDFGAIGLWVIKMLSVLSSWLSYSLVSFLNKNKPWVFRNIFPCARHLKILFIVLFIIWMKVKLSVNQNCLPGPKIWFWKLQLSMWSLKPQQGTRVQSWLLPLPQQSIPPASNHGYFVTHHDMSTFLPYTITDFSMSPTRFHLPSLTQSDKWIYLKQQVRGSYVKHRN